MANKSEGIPQQRSAWDTAPEGNPRAQMGQSRPGGLGINHALIRQMAPGIVAPTVMPGGEVFGATRPPIWHINTARPGSARPKQKTDGAAVAPVNNPFAEGGY